MITSETFSTFLGLWILQKDALLLETCPASWEGRLDILDWSDSKCQMTDLFWVTGTPPIPEGSLQLTCCTWTCWSPAGLCWSEFLIPRRCFPGPGPLVWQQLSSSLKQRRNRCTSLAKTVRGTGRIFAVRWWPSAMPGLFFARRWPSMMLSLLLVASSPGNGTHRA